MTRKFFLDKAWGFTQWSEEQARQRATELGLAWAPPLTRWVQASRDFFDAYGHSPTMRPLVKHLRQLDSSITSIQLQAVLPANPALVLSYVAGIPRPKACF